MRSISGFNSSYLGGSFGAGEYVTASALNKMGVGLDMNRTMMSQGIEFMNSAGGVAFNTPQDVIDISNSAPPFFVYLVKEEGADAVRVVTGTVNNVIPLINGTIMTNQAYTPILLPTSAGDYVVTIKCKADPAPAFFPRLDSEIKIESYPTTDTDTEGYISLATVTVTVTSGVPSYAINQLVSGSLWAERHKYTEPDTASYFFYRV
jgi:hypothetical protein